MSGEPEVVPNARPRRRRRRLVATVASVVSLALVAGLIVGIWVFRPDSSRLDAQVEKLDSFGGEVRGKPWEQRDQPHVELPEAVWPSGSARVRLSGSDETRVGDLPVWVARGIRSRLSEVAVEMLDRSAAWRDALLMRVGGGESGGEARLSVGYDSFRYAYGAGWSERLRLWQVPECALSTPEAEGCAATPLPTRHETDTARVTADVELPADGQTLLAVAAEASGSSGDFAASSLAPSATWSSGGGTGDFSWSYPMRTPPGLGGPQPKLVVSYSSSSVDGRSEATNNQPSWIGEGFEYWPGYIERRYVQCADDMDEVNKRKPNNTTKTPDLCWRSDNATMVLNGGGTELIWEDGKGWHARREDAAKIEKLNNTSNGDNDGEHWKVTTADGTQYFFGLNRLPGHSAVTNSAWTVPVYGNHPGEPCHATSFANSECTQVWRWNLDYVVDPRGNTLSYWYGKEINRYAARTTDSAVKSYVRGGYLERIEYGTWDRGETDRSVTPTARVLFAVKDRCLSDSCGTHNATNWPDVPWDQHCDSTEKCAGKYAPTFWTTKRLEKITTSVWDTTKSPAAWQDVDSWTFTHSFPSPGDGTNAGLWLSSIQHRGLVGDEDIVMPPVTFEPVSMVNRVLTSNNTTNAWQRISNIVTETGARIQVSYSEPECTDDHVPPEPHNNTMRCYPVITPDPYSSNGALITEWWHKYVVTQVSETDIQLEGGHESPPKNTHYEYDKGGPAWHYADDDGLTNPKYKTWNQFRGYATVITKVGDDPAQQTLTKTTFLRGMHGDRATPDGGTRTVTVGASIGSETVYDEDAFAGMVREQVTYNGVESKPVSKKVNVPWQSSPTASRTINGDTVTARFVDTQTTYQATALGRDGQDGWRITRSHSTLESDYGTVITTQNDGDISVDGDETCVRTSYNRNTANNIVRLPKQVTTTALSCDTAPTEPEHIISDVRTSYDGADSPDTPPSYGSPSKVESLKDWTPSGGTVFQTVSQTSYDAFGRPASTTDVRGNTTTIAYTPASGGPVTQITETTAAPYYWRTTKNIAVYWGSSTKITDPNDRVTEAAYDALGRVVKVWQPGWSRTGHENQPSAEYSYTYSPTRSDYPYLTTRTLNAAGGYTVSYQIFDGLLRPRQTQTAAVPVGTGKPPTDESTEDDSEEDGDDEEGDDEDAGRIVTDTIYDAWGRVVLTYRAHAEPGNPSGTLLWEPEWSIPAVNKTIYDRANRPIAEVFLAGDGKTNLVERWRTTTIHAGDRTMVIPPAGGVPTTTITDIDGRTIELRQHTTESGVDGAYQATTYMYNRKGDLTEVIDPNGNTWRYTYDLQGRLITSVDPDSGTTTHTYNDYGDLLTRTDARGEVLAYEYDQLGRKIGLYDGTDEGANQLAAWHYDKIGQRAVHGQLTRTTRYDGDNTYEIGITGFNDRYQPLGLAYLIPAAETGLSGTYTVAYEYSAYDGSPTAVTYPAAAGLGAEKVTTVYDKTTGLPTKLTTNLTGVGSYVVGQQYSAYGEPTLTTLKTAGGRYIEDAVYYDHVTRWVGRQVVKPESTARTVVDRHFDYDHVGNITSIVDAPEIGATDRQCFRYDALRRLTSAWTPADGCDVGPDVDRLGGPEPYWVDWTFDGIGNRLTEKWHSAAGTTTHTYGVPEPGSDVVRPHAVTSVTTETPDQMTVTVAYEYDEAGNTISRPGQTLTWDAEGKLRTVTQDGSAIMTNLYDVEGARLIRRDATGKTLYLPGMELRYTTSGSVKTLTRYYTFNGKTVASRTGGTGNQHLTWLFSDHQGTQQTAINAADHSATTRRQTPYGGPRPGGNAPAWPNEKGFVGGDVDPSGLIHIGARDYDPVLGRFISVDPVHDLTDPQQWNPYAYSNNNPTTFSDPTGLKACSDDNCGPGADWVDTQGNYHSVPGHNDGCGGCSGAHDPTQYDPPGRYKVGEIPPGGVDPATAARRAAEEAKRRAKAAIIRAALALGKIALEEFGITDAFNCFTKGDIGGCLETAITVATSFVGGLLAKFARKYAAPWKWDDAARLGARVKNLLGDLINGVKKYLGTSCRDVGNSFAAGTLVVLADGTTKPIEELVNGDVVLATDTETGRTEGKPVEATITGTGAKHLVAITIDTDGADGASTSTVTATDGHPFWVPDLGEWIDATDLQPGQWLQTGSGTWVQITAVERWTEDTTVYNLTVTGIHTYYVLAGDTSVLVHNCGRIDGVDVSRGDTDISVMHKASGSGMIAELDDQGVLTLAIYRNEGSPVSGREMFDMAMEHFGSRVRKIEGNWFHGTNLNKFNEQTARGVPASVAAAQTWTGRQAARYGFTAVESVDARGTPGAYTRVTARFVRP